MPLMVNKKHWSGLISPKSELTREVSHTYCLGISTSHDCIKVKQSFKLGCVPN